VVVRQASAQGTTENVRGGRGKVAEVNLIDGTWDGGYFQIVNSVLTPPQTCSSTIRPTAQLSGLDVALNRTGLWETLDHLKNVTCLAPNNNAFAAAGSPQTQLDPQKLTQALLFHTLPQPLYSNFLYDGLEITSAANLTVHVTVNSSGIWFNDAKVISPNVLTNNGLVHILDKVMSPLNTTNQTSPTSTGSSPSKTSSATGTSTTAKGAGNNLQASVQMLITAIAFSALLYL